MNGNTVESSPSDNSLLDFEIPSQKSFERISLPDSDFHSANIVIHYLSNLTHDKVLHILQVRIQTNNSNINDGLLLCYSVWCYCTVFTHLGKASVYKISDGIGTIWSHFPCTQIFFQEYVPGIQL